MKLYTTDNGGTLILPELILPTRLIKEAQAMDAILLDLEALCQSCILPERGVQPRCLGHDQDHLSAAADNLAQLPGSAGRPGRYAQPADSTA
jgi:hypothetical protein